jgi:hypothetical protein
VARLQAELGAERKRAEELAVRAERLEVGSGTATFLGVLGNLVSLVGAGCLSYAGAAPNLTDANKARWIGAGIATILIGMVFLVAGPAFAYWVRPRQ